MNNRLKVVSEVVTCIDIITNHNKNQNEIMKKKQTVTKSELAQIINSIESFLQRWVDDVIYFHEIEYTIDGIVYECYEQNNKGNNSCSWNDTAFAHMLRNYKCIDGKPLGYHGGNVFIL